MHKYIHLHTIYYTDTRVSHSIRRSRATKELSRARRRDFSFSSVKEAHSMQTSECALQHMWNTAKLFEISIPSFLRVYSAEYENESTKRFYANERMYRHDDFTWKVTKKKCSQTFPRIWNVFLLERVLKWFVFKKKLSSGLPIS